MNSKLFSNTARFIILVFLQVLILNNINFAGYINPYLYVLFILLYHFAGNDLQWNPKHIKLPELWWNSISDFITVIYPPASVLVQGSNT